MRGECAQSMCSGVSSGWGFEETRRVILRSDFDIKCVFYVSAVHIIGNQNIRE